VWFSAEMKASRTWAASAAGIDGNVWKESGHATPQKSSESVCDGVMQPGKHGKIQTAALIPTKSHAKLQALQAC